jgi:hypothetical protein
MNVEPHFKKAGLAIVLAWGFVLWIYPSAIQSLLFVPEVNPNVAALGEVKPRHFFWQKEGVKFRHCAVV